MAANRAGFDALADRAARAARRVRARHLASSCSAAGCRRRCCSAPIGVLEMAHRDADLAVARAAAAEGVPMVFSNQASVPMEEVAAAMGDAPRWFQLYWSTSDELVESFVAPRRGVRLRGDRASRSTRRMLGWRARDLDLGYLPFARGMGIAQYTSDPVFARLVDERRRRPADAPAPRPTPRRAAHAARHRPRRTPARSWTTCARRGRARRSQTLPRRSTRGPSLTWADLAFLRERTRLPILLKGILHPDDARRALDDGRRRRSSSPTTAAARSTARSRRSTRCPASSRPSAPACRCCSTAASAAAPTSSRRCALGATRGAARPPVRLRAGDRRRGRACATCSRNLMADFDLTMGLSGCARWPRSAARRSSRCLEPGDDRAELADRAAQREVLGSGGGAPREPHDLRRRRARADRPGRAGRRRRAPGRARAARRAPRAAARARRAPRPRRAGRSPPRRARRRPSSSPATSASSAASPRGRAVAVERARDAGAEQPERAVRRDHDVARAQVVRRQPGAEHGRAVGVRERPRGAARDRAAARRRRPSCPRAGRRRARSRPRARRASAGPRRRRSRAWRGRPGAAGRPRARGRARRGRACAGRAAPPAASRRGKAARSGPASPSSSATSLRTERSTPGPADLDGDRRPVELAAVDLRGGRDRERLGLERVEHLGRGLLPGLAQDPLDLGRAQLGRTPRPARPRPRARRPRAARAAARRARGSRRRA